MLRLKKLTASKNDRRLRCGSGRASSSGRPASDSSSGLMNQASSGATASGQSIGSKPGRALSDATARRSIRAAMGRMASDLLDDDGLPVEAEARHGEEDAVAGAEPAL